MTIAPVVEKADWVFTLQSIKSRIETLLTPEGAKSDLWFLLYSPLNQGLKHVDERGEMKGNVGFYSTVH